MERIEHSNARRYSVIFSKAQNNLSIVEEYQYRGLTFRLPLGELLFTVIESGAYLIKNYPDETERDRQLDDFFSAREYYLKDFTCGFPNVKDEVKSIEKIINYVIRISDKTDFFNHESLKALFYSVLPMDHQFICLFDTMERYRIRRISSKLTLPFGSSTNEISTKLSESYAAFSFETITIFHTLTELCLLSLFEILESGQFVLRCKNCSRLYAGKRKKYLCNRPAPINDHKGCEKQKKSEYNKQYRKPDSVREYRKVYNRLQQRISRSTQSLSDVQTFEAFKRDWALLRFTYQNLPDFEERKIEFLKSERWK